MNHANIENVWFNQHSDISGREKFHRHHREVHRQTLILIVLIVFIQNLHFWQ